LFRIAYRPQIFAVWANGGEQADTASIDVLILVDQDVVIERLKVSARPLLLLKEANGY
jgi:hypothetical protein